MTTSPVPIRRKENEFPEFKKFNEHDYSTFPAELQLAAVLGNTDGDCGALISPFQILGRIALVCRSFRYINTGINRLRLSGDNSYGIFRLMALGWIPTGLRVLKMVFCIPTEQVYPYDTIPYTSQIANICFSCPNLTVLHLHWPSYQGIIPVTYFDELFDIFSMQLPVNLKNLALMIIIGFNRDCCIKLLRCLPARCPKLEKLTFDGHFTELDILETCPKLKYLQKLKLPFVNIKHPTTLMIPSDISRVLDWFEVNFPSIADPTRCRLGTWNRDFFIDSMLSLSLKDPERFTSTTTELTRRNIHLTIEEFSSRQENCDPKPILDWILSTPYISSKDLFANLCLWTYEEIPVEISVRVIKIAMIYLKEVYNLSTADAWTRIVTEKLSPRRRDALIIELYTNKVEWLSDIGVYEGEIPLIFFSYIPAIKDLMKRDNIDLSYLAENIKYYKFLKDAISRGLWMGEIIAHLCNYPREFLIDLLHERDRWAGACSNSFLYATAVPLLAEHETDISMEDLWKLMKTLGPTFLEFHIPSSLIVNHHIALRMMAAAYSHGRYMNVYTTHESVRIRVNNGRINLPGFYPNWLFYLLRAHVDGTPVDGKQSEVDRILEDFEPLIPRMMEEFDSSGRRPLYYFVQSFRALHAKYLPNGLIFNTIKKVYGMGWSKCVVDNQGTTASEMILYLGGRPTTVFPETDFSAMVIVVPSTEPEIVLPVDI